MYLIISLSASNYAQQEEYHNCTEPDASYAEDYESQTGGWLKPASNVPGEYFRALFLYIGFADDSARYSWDWPAYQLPDYAYRIIDSIPKTTYRTMTISDYWDEMSMGNYDFIGDVYPRCIILPIAYRDSSYGICNKKVISMNRFTDNGTQILFNPDPGNEAIAEYYVEAVVSLPDDIMIYDNSNTIVYNRVLSQGLEKQQVKEEKRYGYVLEQNYPNPFGGAGHSDNPGTEIRYQVSGKESDGTLTEVKIIVDDIMGREVATLVNENIPAGSYTVNFNASNLPSGVYLYELRAGDYRSVKKMSLVK